MIVKLSNNSAFRLESVRCWDRSPETYRLRVFLGDGVIFTVGAADSPSADAVQDLLEQTFGPQADRSVSAFMPHEFKGRPDRWCETCNCPDRHPIHVVAAEPKETGR